MGDLSRNFSRWEFCCDCGCGFDTVDAELLDVLQALRDFFERRVTVTSGCRCVDHNRSESGVPDSQHLIGRAADIVVEGIDAKLVQEWARDHGVPGIGCYHTYTHLDARSGPEARW